MHLVLYPFLQKTSGTFSMILPQKDDTLCFIIIVTLYYYLKTFK
jgi:hypothetical protein